MNLKTTELRNNSGLKPNHKPRPHIVVGHGPGPHDVHVAPVSHTQHQAFMPHMPTKGLAPGLTGNIHLGHVTADVSKLGVPTNCEQLGVSQHWSTQCQRH